jgi:UDP-2,3-diacylglucosamine pyrophosphatase LpxH
VKQQNHEILKSFLTEMTDPNTDVKRFVMLGDVIEMWLYPFNEVPNTVSDILASRDLFNTDVRSFMQLMGKIADNNVQIDVVIGNHDLELQDSVDELKAAISPKITVHPEEFIYNGVVRMEHGHRYDLFNAPLNGLRPVGYFISRAVAQVDFGDSGGSKTIELCRALPQFTSDLSVTLLRSSFIFGTALTQMFETVLDGKYDKYKKKKVKGGTYDYSRKAIALGKNKDQYNDLVSNWRDYYEDTQPNEDPDEFVFGMLKGGCGDNEWWVKRLADPIIIFGHTHEPVPPTEYRNRRDQKTTYVNSGAWIDGSSMTYVDLIENTDSHFTINLVRFEQSSTRFFSNVTHSRDVFIRRPWF